GRAVGGRRRRDRGAGAAGAREAVAAGERVVAGRAHGQAAAAVAGRVVHRDVVVRVVGVRVDARGVAHLDDGIRVLGGAGGMADLDLAIDLEVIALRGGERLLGRTNRLFVRGRSGAAGGEADDADDQGGRQMVHGSLRFVWCLVPPADAPSRLHATME